jgi:hypothetical protein
MRLREVLLTNSFSRDFVDTLLRYRRVEGLRR